MSNEDKFKDLSNSQINHSHHPSPKSCSSQSSLKSKSNGNQTQPSIKKLDPFQKKKSEAKDELIQSPQSESAPNEVPEDDGSLLVDMDTFGQLLEMDDDEEHTFSKSLTWEYFEQAVTTFEEMDAAVASGDLITLSRKGHFLKGSSAALGLTKVKASCEKMQHYGNMKKANGEGALSETEAMQRCKSLLEQLKQEQKLSKAWLERFYAERNV